LPSTFFCRFEGNIRNKIKELEHPHTDDHTTDISSDDKSEHGYIVISQEEPVYSDSTIIEEPLVQQTDQISDADDEDAHTSTDTVDSANEDESAEMFPLAEIGGLLSNFLRAGVGTSLMYPIGRNRLRWSVLVRPSLFSLCRLHTGINLKDQIQYTPN
jgi:hypothetical protein